MTLFLHEFKGCAPAPLANYLKALGTLRLIVEQRADGEARGFWQGEHFCLLSKLSRAEIEAFFLERYEPTPLLSPWNKGCGLLKPGDVGLAPLENSRAGRFESFRRGVTAARLPLDAIAQADAIIRAIKARTKTNRAFQTDEQRQLLARSETLSACLDQLSAQAARPDLSPEKQGELRADITTIESITAAAAKPPTKPEAERLKASSGYKKLLAMAERRFKALKAILIPECRRGWRGPHAQWLAAAVVLDQDGNPQWPSLLGTGGNDGNLDFTNNFMQQLGELFDLAADGRARVVANELLADALYAEPANQLSSAPIGQYQPGAAGGANSSTGFFGGNLVNPWDFVLMMEGSLLFSSRATRRLDPNTFSRASAPFAVRSQAAGFASPGSEKAQRGEQWMPLWSRPATLTDTMALFGEARIQLNRQTANRPVDVARAISRLGVARGIDAFTRYGYLERNGQSTLAVPLGRVSVRERPRAYLIDNLAGWMDRLQRLARANHAPARLVQAERRLSNFVFAALTHDWSSDRWQAILQAAVAVESLQATGTAIEAKPIPPLKSEWILAVNDNSVEVRLALSLGSAAANYTKGRRAIDSVRHHWLPLEPGGTRFKVSEKRLVRDPRVVAFGRDAVADCCAILQRRLIEAHMKAGHHTDSPKDAGGYRSVPLRAVSGCGARLSDLAALLAGEVDLDKVLELARAFMAIRWDSSLKYSLSDSASAKGQPDEAWLALRLALLPRRLFDGCDIPAEPRIVPRLLAGDCAGAIQIALARLRSAGIRPPLEAGVVDVQTARLWAAALVFPIDRGDAQRAVAILDPAMKGLIDA